MTGLGTALLDTSVVIDLDDIPAEALPDDPVISAVTLAELTGGTQASDDAQERAERQERLRRIEPRLLALPFDTEAAHAFGRVYGATRAVGRKPRGPRALDLLIAATALANGLPLVTRNPADVEHLEAIGLQIHAA